MEFWKQTSCPERRPLVKTATLLRGKENKTTTLPQVPSAGRLALAVSRGTAAVALENCGEPTGNSGSGGSFQNYGEKSGVTVLIAPQNSKLPNN